MRAGRKSYGYILSFPSPWVIDILGKLDFDSVFIDGEHGPFDLVQLELPTYANGTPIPTVDVHQPGDTENKSGVFACADIDTTFGHVYFGLGGYAGTDAPIPPYPTATPFMRACDWVTLDDAWPAAVGGDTVTR
jgi:hypothetical protein